MTRRKETSATGLGGPGNIKGVKTSGTEQKLKTRLEMTHETGDENNSKLRGSRRGQDRGKAKGRKSLHQGERRKTAARDRRKKEHVRAQAGGGIPVKRKNWAPGPEGEAKFGRKKGHEVAREGQAASGAGKRMLGTWRNFCSQVLQADERNATLSEG